MSTTSTTPVRRAPRPAAFDQRHAVVALLFAKAAVAVALATWEPHQQPPDHSAIAALSKAEAEDWKRHFADQPLWGNHLEHLVVTTINGPTDFAAMEEDIWQLSCALEGVDSWYGDILATGWNDARKGNRDAIRQSLQQCADYALALTLHSVYRQLAFSTGVFTNSHADTLDAEKNVRTFLRSGYWDGTPLEMQAKLTRMVGCLSFFTDTALFSDVLRPIQAASTSQTPSAVAMVNSVGAAARLAKKSAQQGRAPLPRLPLVCGVGPYGRYMRMAMIWLGLLWEKIKDLRVAQRPGRYGATQGRPAAWSRRTDSPLPRR